MGNKSSKSIVNEEQQRDAEKRLYERINKYNYSENGDHFEYVKWCRERYKFECGMLCGVKEKSRKRL